jgi:hypothetical protein
MRGAVNGGAMRRLAIGIAVPTSYYQFRETGNKRQQGESLASVAGGSVAGLRQRPAVRRNLFGAISTASQHVSRKDPG